MRKVLIIEDDHYSARRLERLITDLDDTVEVHGPLTSVTDVVAELSAHNDYDLVFSDIRLADGDVFEAFRLVMPRAFVIFTTAYDEYAMQAFRHNGLDYLMKPIDADELCAAVRKLDLVSPEAQQAARVPLSRAMDELHPYRERFLVSRGDELRLVRVDDINYFCVDEARVLACTDDGERYPLSVTMTELEGELDPACFFRLSRQYIAHIKAIQRINLFFGSKLVVRLKGCPDERIVVSRDKATLLRKWLDR